MNSQKSLLFILSFTLSIAAWQACSKSDTPAPVTGPLSYGDSVLYLQPSAGDYVVYPTVQRSGTYEGFPEGIEIDDNTGAINVSKSESGLRYKITYTAPDGTTSNTTVVISGINFADQFYRLSQNDTVAVPIYNASPTKALPVAGSTFDEGGTAHLSGCEIKTVNGQINLAQSIRNGLFGNNPRNDDRTDVEIAYRLNDGSNKALNKIKVRLYYYTSMAAVAPDLLQTLQERQTDGVFLRGVSAESVTRAARPRPPCVVIIAN